MVNSLNRQVDLYKGSRVLFDKRLTTTEKEKPKTGLVYINSECLLEKESNRNSGHSWLRGEIVSARDGFYFIRPEERLPSYYNSEKDVFMRANLLYDHALILQLGDLVEFKLGPGNKKKPEAIHVAVISYVPRTTETLQAYMKDACEDDMDKQETIVELLFSKSLWTQKQDYF